MNAYDKALRPLLLEAERKNHVDLSLMQRVSNLIVDFEHDKDVARQSLHRGLAALIEFPVGGDPTAASASAEWRPYASAGTAKRQLT